MTSRNIKGYRVRKDKNGKTIVEEIPYYGWDTSRKLRNRNSPRERPVQTAFANLFGKGKPGQ